MLLTDAAVLGEEEVVVEGAAEVAVLLTEPDVRAAVVDIAAALEVAEAGALEEAAAALTVPVASTLPLTIESGASVLVVLFCVI